MRFADEMELETYVRSLIADHITRTNPDVYALQNKKAVDIVICSDGKSPAVFFFLEVKYYRLAHGRLGFGGESGGGFQPEILKRQSTYFEQNLRWILASEHKEGLLFLPSRTIRKYVAGGSVGQKFNNIRSIIFEEETRLTEPELILELRLWLGGG